MAFFFFYYSEFEFLFLSISITVFRWCMYIRRCLNGHCAFYRFFIRDYRNIFHLTFIVGLFFWETVGIVCVSFCSLSHSTLFVEKMWIFFRWAFHMLLNILSVEKNKIQNIQISNTVKQPVNIHIML